VSTVTERVEQDSGTAASRECEAIWTFLGIEAPCGEPAVGLFRRACVHEHVRDGWMCAGHATTPENGLCLACHELPGALSHECPISITGVTTEVTR